jgi:adenylate cyclase
MSPTGTALVREREARRNEDLVLAEHALIGERRVTVVRLAMIAVFTLDYEVITRLLGEPRVFDPWRMGAGLAYLVFALAMFVSLRRSRPDPAKSFWGPIVATVVDYGLLVFMAERERVTTGNIHPEMGAISFALVLCFSVCRVSLFHVAFSTIVGCLGYLAVGLAHHAFSAVTTPFVMGRLGALGLLIALTNRSLRTMFTGLRRRDNLTRFLPRQIVDRVLDHGEAALDPVQCEVTVLFSDLRGFTAFSETLQPREVLEFLDDYLGHMAQIVKGHEGLVNKFLGDGLLAFWGVPNPTADHATPALKAALDMRRKLAELNASRAARGLPQVRFGVGIHSGPVAAGMLGGADQHEYTIIGDAVNLASRIEGLTKGHGVDILVSENTWALCDGRFRGRRVAEEQVKGRERPVVVYALDGLAPR